MASEAALSRRIVALAPCEGGYASRYCTANGRDEIIGSRLPKTPRFAARTMSVAKVQWAGRREQRRVHSSFPPVMIAKLRMSKTLRVGLVAVLAASLAVAAIASFGGVALIITAVVCLFLLASSVGNAGRLSRSLRVLENRPVAIKVWGAPLPGLSIATRCEIKSMRPLGVGLHLFISIDGGATTHLKVAQPRAANVSDSAAEIREAAYVQWARRRLPVATEQSAVTITVVR